MRPRYSHAVTFAVPFGEDENDPEIATAERNKFVHGILRHFKRPVIFDSSKLLRGFCLERHDGEIESMLRLNPLTVEKVQIGVYRKMVKNRRKSKFWNYVMPACDYDNGGIFKYAFPKKVNADYVAKKMGVVSKFLCFPSTTGNKNKCGRKCSEPMESKFFGLYNRDVASALRLSDVDAVLTRDSVHSLKLKRNMMFAVIKCREKTRVSELMTPRYHVKILRKRQYETVVINHPDLQHFQNVRKKIREYPAFTYYFETDNNCHIDRTLRQLTAGYSSLCFFCNKKNSEGVKGILQLTTETNLDFLNKSSSARGFSWFHISKLYARRKVMPRILAENDCRVLQNDDVEKRVKRPQLSLGRRIYWTTTILHAEQLLLSNKNKWIGAAFFRNRNLAVLKSNCFNTVSKMLANLNPLTSDGFRKLALLNGSSMELVFGNMNAKIPKPPSRKSWKTKYWKILRADSSKLLIIASVSPLLAFVTVDQLKKICYIETMHNITRKKLPEEIKDRAKPMSKCEFAEVT